MDVWMDRRVCGWQWMGGWIDGCVDRWIDVWMDR